MLLKLQRRSQKGVKSGVGYIPFLDQRVNQIEWGKNLDEVRCISKGTVLPDFRYFALFIYFTRIYFGKKGLKNSRYIPFLARLLHQMTSNKH